jgi:hypothetical protein
MFFYTSLFVACVITALLVLYLYNAIADASRSIYRAFLPSSKNKPTSHLDGLKVRSTVNRTPSPWGWKGNDNVIREHGPKAAAANGAGGFDAFINNHSRESASVGWPYREEKSELTGSVYKVSRKTGAAGARRGSGGKPWGW